jgi:perosamine synthetase
MITNNSNSSLSSQILNAIKSVVGEGNTPLHEPTFSGNEMEYLNDCVKSTYVSSIGQYVDRFEADLASYTGAKYAVSVVNGTSALHIALKLAGVITGDEVLVPALTFVATGNAITYCGGVPHFVDSEEVTLGIDAPKLRSYLSDNTSLVAGHCVNKSSGRVIRALIVMHTFGHPSNIKSLISVANEFNIVVVEDAAESLGSFFEGRHTGTFGVVGTLSFNGNKIITTGGGGAIVTDDQEIARRAKHLTTTAKIPHLWEFRHDEIGYNYRMPNLNAALGCAQLEQLDDKLISKRSLFKLYELAFADVQEVTLFREPMNTQSNYWLQALLLGESHSDHRDQILKDTNAVGIMTRPVWVPLDELVQFRNSPSMDLATCKSLSKRLINIPSSPNLIKSKS